jgi:hypothetical protein
MAIRLSLAAVVAVGATARAQQVPRVEYVNPIEGFALTVPEDWDANTGLLKETVFGIGAGGSNFGAPSPFAPTVSFSYLPGSPKEGADTVVRFAQTIGQAMGGSLSAPTVRPTGRGEEWEVALTCRLPVVGDVVGRWFCRQEKGVTYVIGATALARVAAECRDDIDTALGTCHLVNQTVPTCYYREPTENAFLMKLPAGWQAQAQVYRGPDLPMGWFVYKAQSAQGDMGCFEPLRLPVQNAATAQSIATGVGLQALRKEVPDLAVEAVHPLPRAGALLALGARLGATGSETLGAQFHGDVARVDYVGTVGGARVRLRLTVTVSLMTVPMVGPSGQAWFFGAWAPVDKFEALYPVSRSVLGSIWITPQWRKATSDAVRAALKAQIEANRDRLRAGEHAAEEWDSYIRGVDRVKDPDTGDYHEVPYGPGSVWRDAGGQMWRVPPDFGQDATARGWRHIQG